MKFQRKAVIVFICAVTLCGAALTACGSGGSRDGAPKRNVTINVFNWGDYIDEDVLSMFTEETGIAVNYETFATNEDMYTKIKNGGSAYDVLFPSDYMIEKMINEDMLEKLDLSNIPDIKNIDPRFRGLPYDPGNEYSVPYTWGTVGILYNTGMVDDEVNSWDILWNTKYSKNIFMYDSLRDTIGIALKKLGYSLNTVNPAELAEAKEILIQQMPLVRAYVGDPVKDSMVGGEAALALVFSGDAMYCIEENPELAYVVPREGSNVWYDAVVIPKGSKNKAEAEEFINFLCRPDVALMNTEYIGYSTANAEAYKLLPEETQNDYVYWPPDEVFNNCEVYHDLGAFLAEYNRTWTEILASK